MGTRQSALDLLRQDHEAVSDLFEDFDALRERNASAVEKAAVAEQICLKLSIHCEVEAEVFYPVACAAIGAATTLRQERIQRDAIDRLVAEVSKVAASDPRLEAHIAALRRVTERHVSRDQSRVFPKVRAADIDLIALGTRLRNRSRELMAQYSTMLGRDGHEDESADPVGRPY